MAIYSIRDLEKLTGIKAHTIRIWEQRYRLIEPARTETNIRFYSDDNLRHLFNIVLLNRHGFKISKLARMEPEEITRRVADIAQNKDGQINQIDALALAMIDLDEVKFERIFSTYTWEKGFERTMVELVYPFFEKLNVLFLAQSISPAHEKFISNLICRKLLCAIDKESVEHPREAAALLLYLPGNDAQELTLLFLHYLLRKRGQKVVYLGGGISLQDLHDACQTMHPEYVYTMLNEPLPGQSIQSYIDQAAALAGKGKLLLSGPQLFVSPLQLPANAMILNGMPDTLQFLDRLEVAQMHIRQEQARHQQA